MRAIFGLLLIVLAGVAIIMLRPGVAGNKIFEGRLGFAMVPPLVLAAFAMGVALVITS